MPAPDGLRLARLTLRIIAVAFVAFTLVATALVLGSGDIAIDPSRAVTVGGVVNLVVDLAAILFFVPVPAGLPALILGSAIAARLITSNRASKWTLPRWIAWGAASGLVLGALGSTIWFTLLNVDSLDRALLSLLSVMGSLGAVAGAVVGAIVGAYCGRLSRGVAALSGAARAPAARR